MTDPVHNELSGEATTVVQAGSITGGVHFGVLGRPAPTARGIAEWHPFDLDVHPAITVGAGRLPDLPPYVRRAHDDELDALLAARRPVMVVLTGESSTGKTRALYEAVLRHFPDWPVVYPRTAEDLLAVVRAGSGRCGVVAERDPGPPDGLAERLAEAGNIAMLRRLAATGSLQAVMRLAEQELAAGRVAAGVAEVDKLRVPDVVPSRRLLALLLADLLVDAGRGAEALALCRSSEYWPERWVATRLARAGNLTRLRAMADVGLIPAQRELAALLAERGQFAELEDRTRRGDEYAAKQLVVLGRTDLYEVASDRSRSGSK